MRKVPDDGYGGLLYLLIAIAFLVALVWAIVTLIAAALPSHPVAPDVNIVMGSTVTAAFGLVATLITRDKRKNGGDE